MQHVWYGKREVDPCGSDRLARSFLRLDMFCFKKSHVILFLKSHLVLFLKCVAWLATIVSVIFIASHFCIPATRRCVTISQS